MPQVKIVSSKKEVLKEFEARLNSLLWVELRKKRIPIGSSCSGVGICNACEVEVSNEDGTQVVKACLYRVQKNVEVTCRYW